MPFQRLHYTIGAVLVVLGVTAAIVGFAEALHSLLLSVLIEVLLLGLATCASLLRRCSKLSRPPS